MPFAATHHDRTFPTLNAVRAVGALMVVCTHVAFNTGRITYGWTGAVLSRLDFGVTLFFILSGFPLARPFLLSVAREGASAIVAALPVEASPAHPAAVLGRGHRGDAAGPRLTTTPPGRTGSASLTLTQILSSTTCSASSPDPDVEPVHRSCVLRGAPVLSSFCWTRTRRRFWLAPADRVAGRGRALCPRGAVVGMGGHHPRRSRPLRPVAARALAVVPGRSRIRRGQREPRSGPS